MNSQLTTIEGFPVQTGRPHHPGTHLWVLPVDEGIARVGMDPLIIETSGTLAAFAFSPPGTPVAAGEPFGSLEAAKFVGPLTSPVSGTIRAVNAEVLADPSLVERDPYGAGWLVELDVGEAGLRGCLVEPEQIMVWFAAEVADFRLKGALAE